MTALRALLAEIIDYAGLFPPAALDMNTAVRNYAAYRTDRDAWMLGRFVVPVARLAELSGAQAAVSGDTGSPWRLSALLGANPLAEIDAAREFNREHAGRIVIDSLEGRLEPSNVQSAAAACGDDVALFVEGSAQIDPTPLIEAIAQAGVRAKIRTGGVTSDAIPAPERVVQFIRVCLDHRVSFKATAGLHHPLRADYRLTYDAKAPVGTMFGYLNVFLAAALMANGLPDADAARLLDERDAEAFDVSADRISWRGHSLTAEAVAGARTHVAVSFGSCSFREPVDELRSLHLAPARP